MHPLVPYGHVPLETDLKVRTVTSACSLSLSLSPVSPLQKWLIQDQLIDSHFFHFLPFCFSANKVTKVLLPLVLYNQIAAIQFCVYFWPSEIYAKYTNKMHYSKEVSQSKVIKTKQ